MTGVKSVVVMIPNIPLLGDLNRQRLGQSNMRLVSFEWGRRCVKGKRHLPIVSARVGHTSWGHVGPDVWLVLSEVMAFRRRALASAVILAFAASWQQFVQRREPRAPKRPLSCFEGGV